MKFPKSDDETESESSTPHESLPESFEQRIKATIDSVPLYDNNDSDDVNEEIVQPEQKTNGDAENGPNESVELDPSENDVSKDEL